jgi:hypothetical protein
MVMVNKILFSIIVFSLSLHYNLGQTQPNSEITDYHVEIINFTRALNEVSGSKALQNLMRTSTRAIEDTSKLIVTASKFQEMADGMGKFNGFEVYIDKLITPRVAYVYGFAIYEKQPVSFEFTFYKPAEFWIFNGFSWNASVDSDIRNFAKLNVTGLSP